MTAVLAACDPLPRVAHISGDPLPRVAHTPNGARRFDSVDGAFPLGGQP